MFRAKPLSLCDVVDGTEAAGVYEVVQLAGVTEPDDKGELDGFTYVDLELIESWHAAPQNARARISGGPTGDGVIKGHFVALELGEQVAVVLPPPSARGGTRALSSRHVLRPTESGEWFNWSTREELIGAIQDNLSAGKCVSDLVYSARQPSHPPIDESIGTYVVLTEETQ